MDFHPAIVEEQEVDDQEQVDGALGAGCDSRSVSVIPSSCAVWPLFAFGTFSDKYWYYLPLDYRMRGLHTCAHE